MTQCQAVLRSEVTCQGALSFLFSQIKKVCYRYSLINTVVFCHKKKYFSRKFHSKFSLPLLRLANPMPLGLLLEKTKYYPLWVECFRNLSLKKGVILGLS
jgi:hypothetical protein